MSAKRARKDGQLLNHNRARTQASADMLIEAGSKDQYYTKPAVLETIAAFCKDVLTSDMTYVDFSCGTNDFARLIQPRAVIAYDISPTKAAVQSGAITASWFDVTSVPENSVVGLNPPFGYRGNVALRFLTHAASLQPEYIVAILPLVQWKHPCYSEVSSIKLPLNAFYRLPTNEDFEYPTVCHLFKRQPRVTAAPPVTSISGVTVACHVKVVPMAQPTMILVRRVGFYAGRQAYVVKSARVFYVHKDCVQPDVTWETNRHSIDNSFWVVCFDHNLSVEQLIQLVTRIRCQIDKESLTTREEDVKRAPSLNRSNLLRLIRDNWPT